MNAKQTIQEALKTIMSDGEANACEIWKSFNNGTGLTGWHYRRFGQTATFIGSNLTEAIEWIEALADERKHF